MTQENASKVAIEKLKEESKTFFQETKKIFKSCTFACVNVDDFGLHGVWGDFKKRKEASEEKGGISKKTKEFFSLFQRLMPVSSNT